MTVKVGFSRFSALAGRPSRRGLVAAGMLTTIVVIGAAMLLGDGVITPAISVISAVEGIGVVSPVFHSWIVPVSVVILIALFAIQVRGSEGIGRLFGPAMIAWFVAIGVADAVAIVRNPVVLWALDPRHAITFTRHHGFGGFLVLGGVVLAVTGVEALYADLSHFGRTPIVRAWFFFVFPPLLLSYLGQGANLITNPQALADPFYALTPGWTLIPMVVVATAATVIASQALISGAFTLIEQAISLGLSPRLEMRHTSRRIYGQVYLPGVDLALALIVLVVTFRSSDHLAAAYGVAVSMTMLATDVAYYAVITRVLHWRLMYSGTLTAVGMANSVTTPAVVILPILLLDCSVNHKLPSGPAAIAKGAAPVGVANSVTTPAVVIVPTLLLDGSVNHRLPSGPAVIPFVDRPTCIRLVVLPARVIFPTSEPLDSVNQIFPSDPTAIPCSWIPA